ncbi:MAG: hypothetical protein U1G07_19935 [Verrucomicrobiota bacterium]
MPALESIALHPDLVDRKVRVYFSLNAPRRAAVTRDGGLFFVQPAGAASAARFEATAEDELQGEGAPILAFDAATRSVTTQRPEGKRVLPKGN